MSRRTRGSSTSGLVGAFQDRQDPAKPQILTASTLAALTSGLDASDTLECYLLTREARLDGIANSTLPVHKLALGIRYNPSQQSSSVGRRKKPLEITLEYGPARAGEGLLLETVPRVGGRGSESGNHNNKNSKNRRRAATGTAADADDPSSVAWDNRAVVYYTLRIDGYRGADYVASMTGAVLKNLLQTALAYPLQRSRRRYQPFAVHRRAPQQSAPGASSSTTTTTEESGAASASSSSSSSQQPQASEVMVLRSSNDLDFVSALWQHLSEVGVELKPVILPIRWRVHLVASGIRKVVAAGPGPAPAAAPATKNDASSSSSSTSATPPEGTGAGGTVPMHSVASFYQRLYLCIEAIATANYSAYDAAAAPANATAGRLLAADAPAQLPPPQAEEGESDTDGTAPAPDSLDEIDDLEVNVTNADAMEEGGGAPEPQLPGQDSSAGQGPPVDTDQVAQDAQQAAQDAETAAHQAQHSGNEQAAQAAQAAADAAKKAADSTRGQAAMVAQKALLSGDGSSMAETISQCLSSPRYGISRNDSNTTTVYLYWDGNTYYAINLTAPYIRIVSETSQLPRPAQHFTDALSVSQGDGGGDFIDWGIAFAFLMLSMMGLLCLIQKVLGRKLQVSRSLYKFQRWFFDPVHYTLRDLKDPTAWDTSDKLERNGDGHTYTFAEDVIPLSMGGRLGWGTDFILGSVVNDNNYDDTGDSPDEVELVETRPKKQSEEFFPDDLLHGNGQMTPGRNLSNSASPVFLRNPDYVALPDLTRSSKVAVPIGLRSASLHSHDGDSDSDN